MNAMDEFTAIKRQRKYLASLRWTASTPSVRLFEPDTDRTLEHNPTKDELAMFDTACHVSENVGGPDISYAASYELGSAVQKAVLRYLDNRLKELAKRARSEAEAVLAEIP